MRRSEWRRRADHPTTALGWWWCGVWERRVLLFALLPFAVCGVIGAVGGGWGWLALAAANFAFLMTRPARTSDRLRALLPDPPPQGQFRAQVAYRRDGVTTGRDEMALTVVDGWLYAEGVRSHFALRPEDVVSTSDKLGEDYALVLTDGSKVILDALEDRDRQALEGWRKCEKTPEGGPTFPPARIHEQELARWGQWISVSSSLIFLPNIVAAYLHMGGFNGEIRALVAFLFFGMACYGWRKIDRLVKVAMKVRQEEERAALGPPLQGDLGRRLEGDPVKARDTWAG